MKASRMVNAIDTHTAGEPTRIITDGLPHIPGNDMIEKRDWFKGELGHLRSSLMLEPRGHNDMFGAIITEPVTADADAGLIFVDTGGYLDMCGHGTIGVATALVETGVIANKKNKENKLTFNTPAGKVQASLTVQNGQVKNVTIRNVASFWYSSETVDIPTLGKIPLDIAYGGNFFALVDVTDLRIKIEQDNLTKLIKMGLNIREEVNSQLDISHPESEREGRIDLVEFYNENISPPKDAVVFGAGQVDRSPCGSGTSAKMALLYKEGRLELGEEYRYQSLVGTKFTGKLTKETKVGDYEAVIPTITGSAYITSLQRIITEENDPLKHGFQLS